MMTVSFTVSTGDRRGLASSTVRNRLLRIVCKEVPGHGCYASKLQNEGLVGRGGKEEEQRRQRLSEAEPARQGQPQQQQQIAGYEISISGTEHSEKVEGLSKRGGGEGSSEERRVRARPSDQPSKSGPPGAECTRPARAARSSGGKDRHSKVNTAKGPRDRRVRLSVPTAVQFYDVQDRLGFDQPSKAVEWLIKHAKAAIDELEQLPSVRQGEPAASFEQQPQTTSSTVSTFSAGLPGVLAAPLPESSSTSYGTYDSHGQPAMMSTFGHTGHGMEAVMGPQHQHHHLASYGLNFPLEQQAGLFRAGSSGDSQAGGSGTARVESRAKARERARERAKEKHITERDPGTGRISSSMVTHHVPASASAGMQQQHPHLVQSPYANLPSQVSSALLHPFQASPAFNASTGIHPPSRPPPPAATPYHASSYGFSESSFVYSGHYNPPPTPYNQAEPSLHQQQQQLPSVSHYFVENPPPPSHYSSSNPQGMNTPKPMTLPGFSPGPASSSLRASLFGSVISEQHQSLHYSSGSYLSPSGYYFPPSYASIAQRPPPSSSPLLGPSLPGSSLRPSQGTMRYTLPGMRSDQEQARGHEQQQQQEEELGTHDQTPHSLDPNFYTSQIPARLQGLEELEEEFKR
uniref:TCP domain-containing protein n=1 Tax=Physcomitrium patens TaxID=3218 RepID=A0A2K1JWG7_PHYPA|nr:hypothetical protein PHYPA_015630 [Physcomitrium patens]